jgi:flagellar hook-associated protein 1 FlgK
MSLAQALATAVSGMQTTQAGLAIVAGNVANAETPGYVRRALVQTESGGGEFAAGVRVEGINRTLNQFLQSQYRAESAGGAYADLRSDMYQRLQSVYGVPGADGGIDSIYNAFTGALQALATSPDDYSARAGVISSAQLLAQKLNGMTADIQGLRGQAELGLADSVDQANQAIQQIAAINRQLATAATGDAAAASLMDQRDRYIDQLSQLIDVRVVQTGDRSPVTIFTTSGVQLVGSDAAVLEFTPQGAMTAGAQWSADPQQRAVGTITLSSASGASVDLVANKSIRSGKIAAYLEMRDQTLVQAQAQIDQIASSVASALSSRSIDGTAVTAGAQSGFDIDVGGLSNGNSVSVAYTDRTGATHHITLVQVSDPSALPLAAATTDAADKIIGVDFSQGMASALAEINKQFNGKIQFSNPSGNILRVLDDGAANNTTITDASATVTATSLTGGGPELPFFTDAGRPYTGAITGAGAQSVGFAGRIQVNSDLLADPSKLVVYGANVAQGDSTRPDFLYEQLTSARHIYSPTAGIGTTATPFSASIPTYMQQMLSMQGAAADSAAQLQQGQDVVVNALAQRMSEDTGVNIDEEMTQLLQLQNTYAANAHVLSAVKDMMDVLLKM